MEGFDWSVLIGVIAAVLGPFLATEAALRGQRKERLRSDLLSRLVMLIELSYKRPVPVQPTRDAFLEWRRAAIVEVRAARLLLMGQQAADKPRADLRSVLDTLNQSVFDGKAIDEAMTIAIEAIHQFLETQTDY